MKRSKYQRRTLDQEIAEVEALNDIQSYRLRCTWHTHLVIVDAPSGTRYDFQPGEVKKVKPIDFDYLLTKEKQQSGGCCGGGGPSVIKYFEEAH